MTKRVFGIGGAVIVAGLIAAGIVLVPVKHDVQKVAEPAHDTSSHQFRHQATVFE